MGGSRIDGGRSLVGAGTRSGIWSIARSFARPAIRSVKNAAPRARAFDEWRPLVWDLLLTGCLLFGGLIDILSGGWRQVALDPGVPLWLVAVCTLGLALPLLRRRTHPRETLLVMLPFALVHAWSGAGLQIGAFCLLVIVFNVALRLGVRQLALTAMLLGATVAVNATRFPEGDWGRQLQPPLTSFAVVALLGIAVRTRREYRAAMVERANQREIERAQQAQLAAAAERTRIAREMHDILGHNLSVITGLADGGSYAAKKNPQRAVEALDAIGTTSRQALTELRRLLGILQEQPGTADPADLAPQPGLGDLDLLIDGVRSAGLPVRLTVSGSLDAAPAGRQLTVYRVVQEALTNTLKHAGPGATAEVALSRTPGAITAEISDTGTGHAGVGATGGTGAEGRGITGMRDRTALYAGTLDVGPLPLPKGGWQVRLQLPNDEDSGL